MVLYLKLQQSLPAVPGEGEPELPDVPTEEPAGRSYVVYYTCRLLYVCKKQYLCYSETRFKLF